MVDAWRTRDMLLEDRKVKTQHVVEVAHGIIASYHKLSEAGAMPEADTQEAALAEIASELSERAELMNREVGSFLERVRAWSGNPLWAPPVA